MRTKPKWYVPMQAIVLSFALVLTGCPNIENGNLWGGKSSRGDSNNPQVLNADAEIALRNKDYSSALDLYERVLAQQPNNSQALYGAAASAVGTAGLNIADLLSQITDQLGGSSVNGLSELIAQAREVIDSSAVGDSDSILDGVLLAQLDAIIDLAICRLLRIVTGATDGTISPNDIDVLLNVASLCVIRGPLRGLRNGWLDVQNVNGEFVTVIDSSIATNFCTSASTDLTQKAIIEGIAKDIVGAYALFNRAVDLLNLSGNPIIVQLRDDVQTAAAQLFSTGADQIVPTVCINFFTAIGITAANFTSNNDVFNDVPSGC